MPANDAEPKRRVRRGRHPLAVKAITVKVAISPALHAHLQALVEFGWGSEVSDVMRTLATNEVRRLQDLGRLPDRPADSTVTA